MNLVDVDENYSLDDDTLHKIKKRFYRLDENYSLDDDTLHKIKKRFYRLDENCSWMMILYIK